MLGCVDDHNRHRRDLLLELESELLLKRSCQRRR
jgi:hypothetical protein